MPELSTTNSTSSSSRSRVPFLVLNIYIRHTSHSSPDYCFNSACRSSTFQKFAKDKKSFTKHYETNPFIYFDYFSQLSQSCPLRSTALRTSHRFLPIPNMSAAKRFISTFFSRSTELHQHPCGSDLTHKTVDLLWHSFLKLIPLEHSDAVWHHLL